jgi:hypothetical protein
MIVEVARETVELVCPRGHPSLRAEYRVVRNRDPDDGEQVVYFTPDGSPVPSPYDVDGAPLCPDCGVPMRARLVDRRIEDTPPVTR